MFFEQLEKLCKEKGIKLTPLIKSLGMSAGSIERWRNGTSPNGDTLLKFAQYFNVTTDYLLTGKEPEKKAEENTEISVESLLSSQGIEDDEFLATIQNLINLRKKVEHNRKLDAEASGEFLEKGLGS